MAVADNETFAGNYIITGRNEFLQSIDHAQKNIRAELHVLEQMVLDSTARHFLLDSLAPFIDKRIAFSRGTGCAPAKICCRSGSRFFNIRFRAILHAGIRRLADKVQAREDELLALRKKKNNKNISQLSTTLYIVLAAVFILSMLIIRKVRSDVRFIIQRRKREEDLRKSEERFRLLVSNVKDYAIYMIDTDGKVASWNSGAKILKVIKLMKL